jgi:two-component system sensor histidine kinase KdpD
MVLFKENRGSLPRALVRVAGALVLIAGITLVFSRLLSVNSTTVALSFLLAVLGIATLGGLLEATVASVAGVLCFNYFFLPPVGTLTIEDPENWVALVVFLVTSVVGSQLAASAKRREVDAMRRQSEMERLYVLSRSLMLLDSHSAAAGQVAYQIAQAFELSCVAFFDRERDQVYRAGPRDLPVPDGKLRDAAVQGTAFEESLANISILPVSLGGVTVGSLGIHRETISDTALHAIANLAAIAVERARAQELASRAEAARQNQELKSTLLDAIAHEFNTPLTSIKAAASAMFDEDAAGQMELASIIEEETDRLSSLVTEAIQMARIEAGEVRLQKQPQDVAGLVSAALRKLGLSLKDREVRVELPESLPTVLVDAELAGLAIRQLVSNALKYSDPESPILVRARAEEGCVVISVKDHGPGIPERELARIFERFYRTADSSGRIPGTGMGLTIAREIAQAHGGKIWAESQVGQGSEFSLALPCVDGGGTA